MLSKVGVESSVRAALITLVLQLVFRLLGRFVYRLFVRLVRNHVSTCRNFGYGFSSSRLKGSPLTHLSLGFWVAFVGVVNWAHRLVL